MRVGDDFNCDTFGSNSGAGEYSGNVPGGDPSKPVSDGVEEPSGDCGVMDDIGDDVDKLLPTSSRTTNAGISVPGE